MKTLEEMKIEKQISKTLYDSPLTYTVEDVRCLKNLFVDLLKQALAEILLERAENYDWKNSFDKKFNNGWNNYRYELQQNIKTFFGEEEK